MTRITPFFNYDPAIVQAWLEDMAEKGWFVYEYKGMTASFWKEEPKTVRFRVEPARNDDSRPSVEEQETYRAMGWEYVCPLWRGHHIWRCDDPEVPELNTDPQVQAAGYDYLTRCSRKGYIFLGIFWAVVLATVLAAKLWMKDYPIKLLQNWTPWYTEVPVYVGAGVALLVLTYIEWRTARYLRTLRAGVPQPNRRPYRLSIAMSWLMMALVAMVICARVADLLMPNSHSFREVSAYEETVPCVELPNAEDIMAIHWDNWRTKDQWLVTQGWDTDFTESWYYEFRTLRKAEKTAQLLVELESLIPVETEVLDGAWQRRIEVREDHSYQRLVLWEGRQVMEVTYGGEDDVTAYLDRYEALLG